MVVQAAAELQDAAVQENDKAEASPASTAQQEPADALAQQVRLFLLPCVLCMRPSSSNRHGWSNAALDGHCNDSCLQLVGIHRTAFTVLHGIMLCDDIPTQQDSVKPLHRSAFFHSHLYQL